MCVWCVLEQACGYDQPVTAACAWRFTRSVKAPSPTDAHQQQRAESTLGIQSKLAGPPTPGVCVWCVFEQAHTQRDGRAFTGAEKNGFDSGANARAETHTHTHTHTLYLNLEGGKGNKRETGREKGGRRRPGGALGGAKGPMCVRARMQDATHTPTKRRRCAKASHKQNGAKHPSSRANKGGAAQTLTLSRLRARALTHTLSRYLEEHVTCQSPEN